ncbi:unnamed protein product, partial [Discosporangium mesarthrocarpum]
VGKHITDLGGVPPSVFPAATSLHLANNSIASLEGLRPFSRLASLSLANNLLAYPSDLGPLAALSQLRSLGLGGNPVCRFPSCRAHALALVPGLGVLDGVEV